ncbi:hypothetical protein HDV05_001983 [Chytridiales sp. JEL 0842]|nr:hypothetical protein HDV05_001983 [Chytridiales sp. JEL 0842]
MQPSQPPPTLQQHQQQQPYQHHAYAPLSRPSLPGPSAGVMNGAYHQLPPPTPRPNLQSHQQPFPAASQQQVQILYAPSTPYFNAPSSQSPSRPLTPQSQYIPHPQFHNTHSRPPLAPPPSGYHIQPSYGPPPAQQQARPPPGMPYQRPPPPPPRQEFLPQPSVSNSYSSPRSYKSSQSPQTIASSNGRHIQEPRNESSCSVHVVDLKTLWSSLLPANSPPPTESVLDHIYDNTEKWNLARCLAGVAGKGAKGLVFRCKSWCANPAADTSKGNGADWLRGTEDFVEGINSNGPTHNDQSQPQRLSPATISLLNVGADKVLTFVHLPGGCSNSKHWDLAKTLSTISIPAGVYITQNSQWTLEFGSKLDQCRFFAPRTPHNNESDLVVESCVGRASYLPAQSREDVNKIVIPLGCSKKMLVLYAIDSVGLQPNVESTKRVSEVEESSAVSSKRVKRESSLDGGHARTGTAMDTITPRSTPAQPSPPQAAADRRNSDSYATTPLVIVNGDSDANGLFFQACGLRYSRSLAKLSSAAASSDKEKKEEEDGEKSVPSSEGPSLDGSPVAVAAAVTTEGEHAGMKAISLEQGGMEAISLLAAAAETRRSPRATSVDRLQPNPDSEIPSTTFNTADEPDQETSKPPAMGARRKSASDKIADDLVEALFGETKRPKSASDSRGASLRERGDVKLERIDVDALWDQSKDEDKLEGRLESRIRVEDDTRVHQLKQKAAAEEEEDSMDPAKLKMRQDRLEARVKARSMIEQLVEDNTVQQETMEEMEMEKELAEMMAAEKMEGQGVHSNEKIQEQEGEDWYEGKVYGAAPTTDFTPRYLRRSAVAESRASGTESATTTIGSLDPHTRFQELHTTSSGLLNTPTLLLALSLENAQDIKTLDIASKCDWTETMIISTGRSKKQLASMLDSVRRVVKKYYVDSDASIPTPMVVEGGQSEDWMCLDLGRFVVHAFTPQAREFYNLEGLWTGMDERDDLEGMGETIGGEKEMIDPDVDLEKALKEWTPEQWEDWKMLKTVERAWDGRPVSVVKTKQTEAEDLMTEAEMMQRLRSGREVIRR